MNRLYIILPTLILPIGFYSLFGFSGPTDGSKQKLEVIHRTPISVWSVYIGKVESEKTIAIASQLGGKATIIDLVSEGVLVKTNDLLVRFDATEIERERLKNQKEYALTKSELETLTNAVIPLEINELELDLMGLRNKYKEEKQNLDESRLLVSESLASQREVDKQVIKVSEIKSELSTLVKKIKYTKQYIHPSEIKKAQVKLDAAEQSLKFSDDRLDNTIIRAPIDGIVVYKPLSFGGSIRAIRIGDTIFSNQTFMLLPNLDSLIVNTAVPESELSRISLGNKVVIHPIAYPELTIDGSIARISTMAQNIPGRPNWQRYFWVTINLINPKKIVKPGMSATVHILTSHNPNALVISRSAVFWESGQAYCKVTNRFSNKKRELKLGMANNTHFEILDGLKEGDNVVSP